MWNSRFANLARCVGSVIALASFVPVAFMASNTSAYDTAVVALQNAGVIDGARDGNVRLFDGVNRAEALKIILKAEPRFASAVTRINGSMPSLQLFPDVNLTAWYAPYVEVGFQYKLVQGYPDGTFHPEAGVTAAEAAAMLQRSFGQGLQESSFLTSSDLPNVDGQWYTSAVSFLHARGVVVPGSRMKPGQALTRGQLFLLVYGLMHGNGQVPSVATAPVTQTTNTPPAIDQGAALKYASSKPFSISIPSLNIIDLTVTHPQDPYSNDGVLAPLKDGVGHLFGYPGEGSKILIYGHSSGYPWDLSPFTKIFRTINQLKEGHLVYVTYQGKLFIYEVISRVAVKANDRSAFEPDSNGEQLILYTCWPPDSISQRLLITAAPVATIALR
jgi:LPXTG-site transpeptidase (sortase) family protein